ncbi:ATP-binding protein [Candidatus Babeliales bacterium]|nr:ATP-binding protein [Candidatus Babeliales bacterium]
MRKKIGHILSGSLSQGLVMRLEYSCSLEDVKTGKFVSIAGKQYKFFSLITDIELGVTNPDILLFPPEEDENLLSDILKKRDIYAKVNLRPMLMLDKDKNKMPVKTIPEHFAMVYEASSQDVAQIFGDEKSSEKYFNIGVPLDMDTPVCLNLDLFTERSNGIFGKSGTGKTFITRLILAGLIKSKKAVNLIFDMHSEYGFQARKEGYGQSFVKGLKTLFTNEIAIFSLDPESTRKRGCCADVEVILSYKDIHVEDILSLQSELNLHPTALEAAYLIYSKYKQDWLSVLLDQGESIKEFAQIIGAHAESVGALYRKLKRLERFSFLQKKIQQKSVIEKLVNYLDRGINVILEFGNNTSLLCYLLVANIITRRIHDVYVSKTEKFLASQKKEDEPTKLMITIEEAHKFLNYQSAKQTIFGIIAREMRKYYVSLLVVDQRPSSIDEEIISQIGTKIVSLLNDEKDIQAVLTGVNNSSGLRSILSTLDTKKQALIMGHAVPMPVVIKTREYDEKFYGAMGAYIKEKDIQKVIDQIF